MNPGFDRREALQMLQFSADLDGFGVAGVGPPDTGEWTQVDSSAPYPKAAGNLAGSFGPFSNCWKLWQNGTNDVYAVAIRGTIGESNSIVEDLMANTMLAESIIVPAGQVATISFRLASTSYRQAEARDWPVAEVHSGFAYGLAAILFDRAHGLMHALRKLAPNSQLYVTGHSQGAAIATLLHSFLHYACADNSEERLSPKERTNFSGGERFGLNEKNFAVKSYVFAQPKPGNWRYAMDFAEAIGNKGLFYTINNHDDPVVQAPLAHQLLSDSMTQQEIASIDQHKFLSFLMRCVAALRRHFSQALDERILDQEFYRDRAGGPYADQIDTSYADGHARKARAAGGSSLNYAPVGTIIALRARKEDNDPQYESQRLAKDTGFLWEHHLWRYQQLSKYWP